MHNIIIYNLQLQFYNSNKFWPSLGYPWGAHVNFIHIYIFFFLWRCSSTRAMASSILRFLDHAQRRTTVDRNPLAGWSARRRDPYLMKHNTHNTNFHNPGRIRTHNLISWAAADLRLIPSGQWDRRFSLHFPEFNIHSYSSPPHALNTQITS